MGDEILRFYAARIPEEVYQKLNKAHKICRVEKQAMVAEAIDAYATKIIIRHLQKSIDKDIIPE